MHTALLVPLALVIASSATPVLVTRQSDGCSFVCPPEYLHTSVSFDRYGYIVCHYEFPNGPYKYNDCSYWLADGGFRGGNPADQWPGSMDTVCASVPASATEPESTA